MSSLATHSVALLIAFVAIESTKSDLTYYLLNRNTSKLNPDIDPAVKPQPLNPSALVLNSELFKCLFSFAKVRYDKETVVIPQGRYLIYAVPAFLYFVNNLIYLIGLSVTSPSDLHAAMLSKIPLTALVHHMLMSRQVSVVAWLFLLLLTGSLVSFSYPLSVSTFLGPLLGVMNSVISAFTSIYTEYVLKQVKISFWTAQFWLYFFGTVFGLISVTVSIIYTAATGPKLPDGTPMSMGSYMLDFVTRVEYLVIPLLTMFSGFAVAFILRAQDNLVKLVGIGLSFPTIMVTQYALFPVLRPQTTLLKWISGAGLCVGSLGFNYFKRTVPGGIVKNAIGGMGQGLDNWLDKHTVFVDTFLTRFANLIEGNGFRDSYTAINPPSGHSMTSVSDEDNNQYSLNIRSSSPKKY